MNSGRSNTRPAPTFNAGDLALDFLNSMATSGQNVVELLANGEDLLSWLVQAQLLHRGDAAVIRANSLPGELNEVAAQARAFREWFRKFVLAHMGRQLTASFCSREGGRPRAPRFSKPSVPVDRTAKYITDREDAIPPGPRSRSPATERELREATRELQLSGLSQLV